MLDHSDNSKIQIPRLNDRRLRMPMIYKNASGKIIGGEGPEEWADKVFEFHQKTFKIIIQNIQIL